MAANDCLSAIKAAGGESSRLDDDELIEILEGIQERYDPAFDGFGSSEGWQAAAEAYKKERTFALREKIRGEKINISAKNRLLTMAKDADAATGKPHLGLVAATVGVNANIKNARLSADYIQKGLFEQRMGGILADLDAENLLPYFNSDDMDLDIAKALEKLTNPRATGTPSTPAMKVARILDKHRRIAFEARNRAGASARELPGHVTKVTHDARRIEKMGEQTWIDTILPLLDHEKTFGRSQQRLDDVLRASDDAANDARLLNQELKEVASTVQAARRQLRSKKNSLSAAKARDKHFTAVDKALNTELKKLFNRLESTSIQTPKGIQALEAQAKVVSDRFAVVTKQIVNKEENIEFREALLKDTTDALAAVDSTLKATDDASLKEARVKLRKIQRSEEVTLLTNQGKLQSLDSALEEIERVSAQIERRLDHLDALEPENVREINKRIDQVEKKIDSASGMAEDAYYKSINLGTEITASVKTLNNAKRLMGIYKKKARAASSASKKLAKRAKQIEGEVRNPTEFLSGAYKTLISGVSNVTTEADSDILIAFKGPRNLARRASTSHKKLHFKSAEAWMEYNKLVGRNTLRESFIEELNGLTRDTALMQTFGTNPRQMVETVLSELAHEHRGSPSKVSGLRQRAVLNQMSVIDGTAASPVHNTFASIGQLLRNIQTMAKLGASVITSLTDVAWMAGAIRYHDGGGVFSPMAKAIGVFFDGLPKESTREVARLLGVGLDGSIGDIAHRFSSDDKNVGMMSKLMRLYFKANLLGPWTDANKRGMGLMLSNDLASQAKKSWSSVPDHTKFQLNQYGIGEEHWGLLKSAIFKADNGNEYLIPDSIRSIPDADMKKAGLTLSDRDVLGASLQAYITDSIDFAIPTQGGRERAILNQGQQAGTPIGEALRFMSQFKAFPTTILTKPLGRATYNNPTGKADYVGLAMMMGTATLMGFTALTLKDIAKGQTPTRGLSTEDPMETLATIRDSLITGGAGGILGDLLLSETENANRDLIADLAGPTAGLFKDIWEVKGKLLAGEGEQAVAEGLRTAINNTPGANLFYLKEGINYLFLNQLQELANPGYMERARDRLAESGSRKFFVQGN